MFNTIKQTTMKDKNGNKLELNQEVFVPETNINNAFYGKVVNIDKDFNAVVVKNDKGYSMSFPSEILTIDSGVDNNDPESWVTTFHVDLPYPDITNKEWVNVKSFGSRKLAIQFAMEHFGADENGMICILSES